MYELSRFQRYRIYLKKLEIRISIEKLNFFLVHLVGSIQTKLKLDNKRETRKQKTRAVCVECSKQTQNSETKNRKRQNSFITESRKYTGDKINL